MARIETNYCLPTNNIWFPDQREPTYSAETIDEFKTYWKKEKERMLHGFYIADGKVFISGWLYWHTVYWKIKRKKAVNGRTFPVISTPDLRDLEWDAGVNFERALDEGTFIELVGSRGFGKTVWQSSYSARLYTLMDKSQTVVSAGNSADIKVVTDKIDEGLSAIHPVLKKKRLKNDWKLEVLAGFKTPDGEISPNSSRSQILVRNYQDGNDSMAANGTRPDFHIIDEIGKIKNFLKCVKDSDGCWWDNDELSDIVKPTCLPMFTGCVCAGTKVWDNEGNLLNIEELIPEKGILGFDNIDRIFSKEDISYWQPPHNKECYKVITNTGRFLECSWDHPILYKRRQDRKVLFREAKYLKVGEQIAIIEEVNLFGNKIMWEPRVVGWLIGDGSYGFDKTPVLSNCDIEINNYIESNFSTVTEKSYQTKEGKIYKETRIKGICSELRKLEVYGQTKLKKTLPKNIHSYRKEDIADVLGGLFDTDGCVYEGKINKVDITSSSESLLLEIQLLLQKFGVHGGIYEVLPNFKNSFDKSIYYRLVIADKKSLLAFHKNITLKLSYKQKKLNNIINVIRDRRSKIDKNQKGLRFERIVSIENIGEQPVYNLTAANTNTYIANGIITHNTGGDMEVGADAAEMFFDPINNNLLAFDDVWEGKGKIGWFVPATKARYEYKVPKSLSEYLGISHPDLDRISILVSDEEKCLKEWWEPRYKKALKSGNSNSLLSFKAYWPIKPSDSFLVLRQNDFNVEAAKAQKDKLVAQGVTGNIVDLFHDGEKIQHKFVDRLPITEYPVKSQDKDAPVQIWEFPLPSPPFGLYTAGVDPYRQGEAEYSSSLGVVYIYKRMHSITSEKYQNMIVACYAARPSSHDKWNETARLLVKYYNARTLCENDEMSFINYMLSKGDGHYLEDQPEWLKEYVPNTKVDRKKGIHRSSLTIRDFLDGTFKSYLDEVIEKETDDNGSIISERLGVTRIPDPMLCEEITKFSKATGKDKVNTDRVVAAELAIALAFKLDPIIGAIQEEDTRIRSLYKAIKGKQSGAEAKWTPSLFSNTRIRTTQKAKLFQ